ncbi:MAG: bifunctional alpha/beta hydrolase/OsmC family protein [Microscillaceae bacterium]
MKTIKVQFENAQGQRLAARLELPLGRRPSDFVLFAHCFTCNKNLTAIRHISQGLTDQGLAVLRFDFTGLGESEGDFADTNFSSNVEDLVAAADFLRQHYQAPALLVGHSLGGAAVLVAKSHIPEVRAVATIGAPYQPEHVTHLFETAQPELEARGVAEVRIGGRKFTLKKQFVEDVARIKTGHLIHDLKAALLVLHSPQDEIVEIDNATQLFKAAQHPRSFISLDGADHLLSRPADSRYVGQTIAAWVSRYLDAAEAIPLSSAYPVVGRIETTPYRVEFQIGAHHLVSDEPVSIGGQDLGPDPYSFLLTALGACTGMTLRMYADRKGWDLQEARVHLQHGKIHAQDCAECETKEGKIDHITRIIELEGNLDATQRQRLVEIADRCPVHRTLHSEVKIDTRLEA